mmetsp:Transcript_93/g.342  ORF Transcript_93/g.342 Transcript_93/m.342 type:complete len:448 (-) Transcript_93:195-1538(-)
MKYPQQWYNFDEALKKSMIELVADSKWLSFALVSSYVFTLAAFGALIAYYKTVSTTESVVHDKYTLDGYTCRPLQRDPDYGLQITYDECMAEHYVSPTVGNLVSEGDYGPQTYAYGDTPVTHNDGPWNFTDTGENGDGTPRSSLKTLTVYHKPFPTLTNQTCTLHEMCRVPFYKGYEKHSAYGFAAIDDAVRSAVERGSLNFDAYGGFSGYSARGLTNHDLEMTDGGALVYPNPSQNIFKLATDTKFVATCGTSTFSAAYEQAVLANGTYVFPHGFGGDMTIWTYDEATWDAALDAPSVTNVSHILLKRNSFGMTPLYPVVPYDGTAYAPDYTSSSMISSMTATTFFGAPRCPYFEKEVSRQAHEYIYSLDNCHPCDSFKFNSPFFCERQVYKTNAEIITLASSNAMALSAAIISITPMLLAYTRHRKSNANTQAPAPDADIVATRI